MTFTNFPSPFFFFLRLYDVVYTLLLTDDVIDMITERKECNDVRATVLWFLFFHFFSIGELDTLGDFGNLGKGMMGFDWHVARRFDRAEDRIPCHLLSSMQIVRCLTWWRKADMAGECHIPVNAKDSRKVWDIASQENF